MEGQSFSGWRTNAPLRSLPTSAVVHAFPLHQIYLEDGRFVQARSGPNWLGGVLTLATCKHYMRLATDPQAWVGEWLAAFTPKVTTGGNYLLLTARVCMAFDSNYAMGRWLQANAPEVYKAKLAVNDPRGDVYSPKKNLRGDAVYAADNYKVPHGHVRMELKNGVPKWHGDIEYTKRGLRPACLLFDKVSLYSQPVYAAARPLYRSGYKCSGEEFMRRCIASVQS